MSFPQTRHSLIQRIARGGEERDWMEFFADYWRPICRFAQRSGRLSIEDAEDVASKTFETLVQNQLLARWITNRSAKLRTMLCQVVRNVLANRARVEQGRVRSLRDMAQDEGSPQKSSSFTDESAELADAFYAAWVEEILKQTIDAILDRYHQEGKVDHFRVLYGNLCEGMSMSRIAQALSLTNSQAENAFKHARKTLAQELEKLVKTHVQRYCPDEAVEEEYVIEWGQLGEFLKEHGGLEETVRHAYQTAFASDLQSDISLHATLKRVRDIIQTKSSPTPGSDAGHPGEPPAEMDRPDSESKDTQG